MGRGRDHRGEAEGLALLEPGTVIPLAVMAALGGLFALRMMAGWGG